MKYTRKNIYFHELIGLKVEVIDHSDPTLRGVKGLVVDETKNTLKILTPHGGEKVVPKHGGKFLFKLPKTVSVEVLGDLIIGRPEDRLKRVRRWKV